VGCDNKVTKGDRVEEAASEPKGNGTAVRTKYGKTEGSKDL